MKNFAIVITPLAYEDLKEAKKWYERISSSLAIRFKKTINQEIDELAENPLKNQTVYKSTRRSVTKTFPYSIFYKVDSDNNTVLIIAVLHHKRNLKTLTKRLQ